MNKDIKQCVSDIAKYCIVLKPYSYNYNTIQLCLKVVEIKRYCNKSFLEILSILHCNNIIPKPHYNDLLRLYNKRQHFIDSLLS